MRAQEFIFENNDDGESGNLKSIDLARQNIGRILSAAQRIYDNWDESDRDTYAGGGICHIIADAICDVMWNIGIECTTVSCSYEQHVYVAVKVEEGVYTIDIPYSIYETGGGFNWQKLPDIQFETGDVVFYRVSGDPEEFENYTALEESQQGVAEGSENLSYIGNCTDDDVIEHIFGDATGFAQAVEEYGDEFTLDDLVVKYDPESDVHSFYYKKQGVAENNLTEFAPSPDFRDDDDRQHMPLLEFAEIIKLFLGSEYTMIDRKTPEQVSVKFDPKDRTSGHNGAVLYSIIGKKQNEYPTVNFQLIDYEQGPQVGRGRRAGTAILKTRANALKIADIIYNTMGLPKQDRRVEENFADGKNPGRKGLAKRMDVPTKASVTRLRQIAKSSSGEKQRMAHWMANMKAGKKK